MFGQYVCYRWAVRNDCRMQIKRKLLCYQDVCRPTIKENDLPIRVFSIMEPGNLRRTLQGDRIGTLIS